MTQNTLASNLNIKLPSAEQQLPWPDAESANIKVFVKRDDAINPIISGNKWRKIKFQLINAEQNNIRHIISFGGGFSNHLHALGYCCFQLGLKFTAIVRGDYSNNLSPMLKDLSRWNADIRYVNKLVYKTRDTELRQTLAAEYPDALIVPEGGSSHYALKGVGEIIQELKQSYDYIVAPVASGGTLAGLIHGLSNTCKTQVLGIGVLKGQDYLERLVTDLLPQANTSCHWQINHDYHFGGYAKKSPELEQFCQEFKQTHNLKIEPVYSGKLFFALQDLIKNQYFPPASKILALHTGGLQGAR